MKQKLLFALELTFLAGMIVLSFYLLYLSFQEGEQAVNGTAILTADETVGVSGSAAGKAAETDGMAGNKAGEMTQTDGMAGNKADEAAQTDSTAGDAADETETDTDDFAEQILFGTADTESLDIRVRILDNAYVKDTFDVITVCGSDGIYIAGGIYDENFSFIPALKTEITMPESGETTTSDIATGDGATGEIVFVETDTEWRILSEDLQEGDALRLSPGDGGTLTVTSLERADGAPEYAGELYLYRLKEGLALVNVLPLEEYLYGVVSSEMPSYFPEEAQKAQAVCARTYALLCMENSADENDLSVHGTDLRYSAETESETEISEKKSSEKKIADLDDSVRFQVYNNRKCTENSREAVDATAGVVLTVDEVFYYSTSCLSENRTDLEQEAALRGFLREVPENGAEYGSAWLRWSVAIPLSRILDQLAEEYEIRADVLEEIAVEERSGSGQALMLRVVADGETLEIEGEYAIRQFLSPEGEEVVLMDGTAVTNLQLLPSAFFYIDAETDGYVFSDRMTSEEKNETAFSGEVYSGENDESHSSDKTDSQGWKDSVLFIYGGGFGHGEGMSQYGAAQMAADGADYKEILNYYYEG